MLARRALIAALVLACAAPAAAQPSSSSSSNNSERNNQRALTSAESYVPIETLSTGVVGRFANSGTLVIDVGLDIPDAALRRRAVSLTPRMRDALRTAIAAYANTYFRDNTAPDPVQLARLMQQAVDRTLGRAGARVLLSNVVYQQRR